MSGLLGRKIGMTRIFDEEGRAIVCTILEVGPCVVTQVKEVARDGYDALQLGFMERKETRTPKPLLGHFKAAGVPPKRFLREFKGFEVHKYQPGDEIRVEDVFAEGDYVDVAGRSKGKGFQGVVKRHGFAGVGMQTHGQHNRERAPGSIGQASFPSRVFKGLRMAGRTGNERVKVKNLGVVKILPEQNLMLVQGAVPGPKNGIVEIYKAK